MAKECPTEFLIALGSVGRTGTPEAQTLLDAVEGYGWINREHWSFWEMVCVELDIDELVALVKGLTLAEVCHRWSGGSVSSVIWTYREVHRRETCHLELAHHLELVSELPDHLELTSELADWILARTENSYVPFGTQNFGARSLGEYKSSSEEHKWLIRRGLDDQFLSESRAAHERPIRRQQRERSAASRKDGSREKFLRSLGELSLLEQLKQLAKDQEFSLEYYPTRLAYEARTKILEELDTDLVTALVWRAKGRRRGPWQKFRRAVICEYLRRTVQGRLPWDRDGWFN
jgi:hypothetical protein